MMNLDNIKSKIKQSKVKIEPLHGVILFAVALLAANLLWKLLIYGDDENPQVLLCNRWDISAPFNAMVAHITDITRAVLRFFNLPFLYYVHNDIHFSLDNGIFIVWGCTAIKQSFIFLCIMLAARGGWRRKLWYIPLGLAAIYLFNIFRISLIAIITSKYPGLFEILHQYILKYLFYGVIFLIWVFWEEKISKKTVCHVSPSLNTTV